MPNTFKGVPANSGKSVQDEYSFPADCYVILFNCSTSSRQAADQQIMFIRYHGAPAALFNNAPQYAMLFNTSGLTWNMKTSAPGTGTWVASAAMS